MKKIVLFILLCALTIGVDAQITPNVSSLSFTTPAGTTSVSQTVELHIDAFVTSPWLTITAPSNYTVSFDNITFSTSIRTSIISGITYAFPVYVEYSPTDSISHAEVLLFSVNGLPIVGLPLGGNGAPAVTTSVVSDSSAVFINEFCSGPEVTVATDYYIPSETVKFYFGDGGTNTVSLTAGAGSATGSAIINHNYQLPGTYTLKAVFMNSGIAFDSISFSYEHRLCNTIPVKYYYDVNANCHYDNGNDMLNSLPVLTEVDSNGIAIDTVSATSGFYYVAYGNVGDVYSFHPLPMSAGLVVSCPATGVIKDTLQSSDYNLKTNYVGIVCGGGTTSFDLKSSMWQRGTGRHVQYLTVETENSYCSPVSSLLTLHFSPKYNFESSYPSPVSVSGNTATFNTDAMSFLGVSSIINITLSRTTFLTPGDTIMNDCNITPTSGDSIPDNNYCVRTDTVKMSFDPNEISVSPSYCLTPGVVTNLQYFITFENTGNDTAHNIYVLDTLPDYINAKSLRIVGTSNTMNIQQYVAGGHNVVKFDFPAINLLDSSHHNQCDGMVAFTVDTKAGLASGTTFVNQAGIYFDDNEVVMTNSASNLIGCPSSVASIENNKQPEVFPNPATNELVIKTNGTGYTNLVISNMVGQQVMQSNITNNETTLNISGLPVGVYYITLAGETGEKVVKFAKQ